MITITVHFYLAKIILIFFVFIKRYFFSQKHSAGGKSRFNSFSTLIIYCNGHLGAFRNEMILASLPATIRREKVENPHQLSSGLLTDTESDPFRN